VKGGDRGVDVASTIKDTRKGKSVVGGLSSDIGKGQLLIRDLENLTQRN
jgi:hypothetical protein